MCKKEKIRKNRETRNKKVKNAEIEKPLRKECDSFVLYHCVVQFKRWQLTEKREKNPKRTGKLASLPKEENSRIQERERHPLRLAAANFSGTAATLWSLRRETQN